MKNNSWKKDYLVVIHSDYDNTWSDRTIPLTLMQAIRYARVRGLMHGIEKGTVKIVTRAEFATLNQKEQTA